MQGGIKIFVNDNIIQLNACRGEARKSPKHEGKLMRIWDLYGFKSSLHKFSIKYKVKQVTQSGEA